LFRIILKVPIVFPIRLCYNFPIFSYYPIIIPGVFKRGVTPNGRWKNINPTRLVVTSGKLLFYLSGGGTGIEPKENPKKKHSDARLFDSPAVLDFSLAKNKPA
jgi:hypothetical protein